MTKRPVVSVLASASVSDAFALLSENAVLSLPVLRDETREHEPLGFVDVLLITRYVLGQLLKDGAVEDNAAVGDISADSVRGVKLDAVSCGELLAAMNVGAVTPFFDGNPATYLPRLFTNHLHRTVVYSEIVKPDGVHRELKMTGICSQTDLVAFLHGLSGKGGPLEDLFAVSLREAGFKRQGAERVGAVPASTTALQALHQMSFWGFRAVAIVDESTAGLLGTFSVESLRGLARKDLGELTRPVLDFVTGRCPAALKPATVKTTTPVSEVLADFVERKLHEAWIVGEDGGVEGVVTQTDLIHALSTRGESLDLARAEMDSKQFAYKLPGKLFIKVASGQSLVGGTLFRTVRAGVRMSLGGDVLLSTDTVPGPNPAWGNTITIDVRPEMVKAGQNLVFTVVDESRRFEEIGFFQISLEWCARAFGTMQGALRNYADAFRIRQDNKPGQVQVEFLWL